MKNNKWIRIAAVLCIVCLLTTCVISGTFAKYVTSANVGDSARVAKWGIKLDSTGKDTFSATYDSTVASSNGTDKIVAPGTTKSVTYSVTGAPEVDYIVSFEGTATKDIFLKGTSKYAYTDGESGVTYTIPGAETVASDYYPVDYKVQIASVNGTFGSSGITSTTEQTYETLALAMDALTNTTLTFDANESCDVVVTITWTWAFSVDADTDKLDTVLGDLMAGNTDLAFKKTDNSAAENGTDYNLNIVFDLAMTATQID